MREKSQERRKHYFIKRKFQLTFILKFCFLVIIGSFISIGLIYAVSRGTVTTSFENSRLVITSTADFILPAVLLSSAIVVLVVGLATMFITLYTSHKIAGPLYRIEKDVNEVASGNLTQKFQLRERDEIKALAESLENMTQMLRSHIGVIKNSVSEIRTVLNQILPGCTIHF